MRLRHAVLQIPSKPPVPRGLPLYKSRHSLTRSKSTLLQVLIPRHFISFISNTYKKPGGGTPSSSPKVLKLVTPSPSPKFVIPSAARSLLFPPPSPCLASLPRYVVTSHSQGSARAQQRPQPQSPLCFTSQLSGYPGGWGYPQVVSTIKCDGEAKHESGIIPRYETQILPFRPALDRDSALTFRIPGPGPICTVSLKTCRGPACRATPRYRVRKNDRPRRSARPR